MLDRYTRQRRLPEVGDAGQARLLAASCRVAASDAAPVEVMYLERAGIGRVSMDAELAPDPFRHAPLFHHAAPRRNGAGAWRALRQILRTLGEHGA